MIQKAFKVWCRKNNIPQSEFYRLFPIWKAAVSWHRKHIETNT